MQHLIRDGFPVENDQWELFSGNSNENIPEYAVLPFSMWTEMSSELVVSSTKFGIIIGENESIESIETFLNHIPLICFKFSKFADGRAFSYARKLRDQLNYQGEIRAMGDFMPDQVGFLERSGFNSFSCRTSAERDTAQVISKNISVKYQSDTLEVNPLFRRR